MNVVGAFQHPSSAAILMLQMLQRGAAARQPGDEDRPIDGFAQDVRLPFLFRLEAQQIGEAAKCIPARGVAAEDVEIGFPFIALKQQPERRKERAVAEFRAAGSPQGLRYQGVPIEAAPSNAERTAHAIEDTDKSLWGQCLHS